MLSEQKTLQSSSFFTGLHRLLELIADVIQQKHNGMEVFQSFSLPYDFIRTNVETWHKLSGI